MQCFVSMMILAKVPYKKWQLAKKVSQILSKLNLVGCGSCWILIWVSKWFYFKGFNFGDLIANVLILLLCVTVQDAQEVGEEDRSVRDT